MSEFYGRAISPQPDEPLVIVEEGWDPRLGRTVTYEWRGRETEIRLMQAAQEALGRRTTLRIPAFVGGEFVLNVVAGASENQPVDEALSDIWELDGNSLEKSIWELPVVAEQFDQITSDVGGGISKTTAIAFVKRAIIAFVEGDDQIKGLSGNTFDLTDEWLFGQAGELSLIGVDPEVFREVAHSLAMGLESWPIPQFVLRRTRVVLNGTSIKPDFKLVLKPLRLATLQSEEKMPDTLLFELQEMPVQGLAAAEGIWVKQTPTVRQTGPDKWTIIEEWWHADRALPFIYGNPV